MDLLRKLHGVVFRHTFQNALHQDAGSVVRNILFGRQHPNTVLFQLRLVDSTVIAVAGKTVQLIYQNALKGVPVAVGDHPLKFGTVVRGAADGSIDILSDNGIMIRLRIFIAHLELSFNGLLRLAVAGKAGVNDYIHTESSSPIFIIVIRSPVSNVPHIPGASVATLQNRPCSRRWCKTYAAPGAWPWQRR